MAVRGWRVHAQRPVLPARTSTADTQFANFAFASELGSGIYEIDGRTISSLPAAAELPAARRRSATARRPGIRLIFPLTVGFFNFQPHGSGAPAVPDPDRRPEPRAGRGARLLAARGLARLSVRQGRRHLRLLRRSQRRDLRARRAQRLPLQHLVDGAELWRAELALRRRAATDGRRCRTIPSRACATAVELRHSVRRPRIRERRVELGPYAIGDIYLDAPCGPATGISARTVQFEAGLMFGVSPHCGSAGACRCRASASATARPASFRAGAW